MRTDDLDLLLVECEKGVTKELVHQVLNIPWLSVTELHHTCLQGTDEECSGLQAGNLIKWF